MIIFLADKTEYGSAGIHGIIAFIQESNQSVPVHILFTAVFFGEM